MTTPELAGRRLLRLVDVDIELTWNDPELQVVGESLYSAAAEGASGGIELSLRRTASGYVLHSADGDAPEHRTLGALFQDAEMAITEAALDSIRHRYLPVHAAVVAHNGTGLLVIGAHDAGKTSLACALARSGADLLSDEVGPVRPTDLSVFPFPRDLILHAGTRRSLGGLPPSPGFKCFDGYRYLPPTTLRSRPSPRAVPVRGLLFPARSAGAQTALTPRGPAESARVLLQQCFDLSGLGGQSVVDCTSRLARLPAADISFSSAADALELVWRWWGEQVLSEVEAAVVG
jgi:hypothetical protein